MGISKSVKNKWWKSILPLIFVVFFAYFLYDQRNEWQNLRFVIAQANFVLLIIGVVLLALFCLVEAYLYKLAFRVIHKEISLGRLVALYLKRYFLSTFIPAGFTVSQYAFTRDLQADDIERRESHLVSTLYLLAGAVSYVLLLIPTLFWLIVSHQLTHAEWAAGIVVILVVIFLGLEFISLFQPTKGLVHTIVERFFPGTKEFFQSWQEHSLHSDSLLRLVGWGLVAHLVSILLLGLVFMALHIQTSIIVVVVSYVITMLVLILSPVFQGIGLVEYSLVYTLRQFNVGHEEAVAVALLYRLFQLWIPLIIGGILIWISDLKSRITTRLSGF